MPHRSLVETAPGKRQVDATTRKTRVQSFMCLGCGSRWRFDPQHGWQSLSV
ncbi:hypothetical protein [Solimonas terrae]|uniref:Uncharacterized protein n=1 Tax=Solimonas terrae TaxID=1396819 RepID=A0A6M2BQM3_9GAMM|nr:hypothetical protein [Solimonas terrae]NGY04377.1 hypothetical protein [Solimonas terrae]